MKNFICSVLIFQQVYFSTLVYVIKKGSHKSAQVNDCFIIVHH